MITTAGKGPRPSGLDTIAGICSEAPLGAIVVIDGPEVVAAQPAKSNKEGSNGISLLSIVLRAES
jgi:hypothetical protein